MTFDSAIQRTLTFLTLSAVANFDEREFAIAVTAPESLRQSFDTLDTDATVLVAVGALVVCRQRNEKTDWRQNDGAKCFEGVHGTAIEW